ncbi:MAG: hypothetical protein IAB19_06170 [Proteobacteria bacterium]|uniref:Antitoxin SocA-like Panacea domain-containing protein n=1 Tax=Candidatus Avisuccinivibrio stercorigallinarum TaxID=2840704 RepID=A0A9D9DA45_9GAMM|nr:hypothetical protein [Candidatus Avisuccinivibrio stercorigallinarum]
MKAQDAARNIINYCFSKGRYVNNIEVQQIMYLLELACYKRTGSKLVTDKPFCLESFGPIIPSVFREYLLYGSDPVSNHLQPNMLFPEFIYETLDKMILKNKLELMVLCIVSQKACKRPLGKNRVMNEEDLESASVVVSCF